MTRSLRVALGAGLLLLACGLVHHDVTIPVVFQVGGGPPTITQTINSTTLTGPLAASAGDLAHVSSVTMQSVHLTTTDAGDLSFVSGATLTLTAAGLPDVGLATLPSPPASGVHDVALLIDGRDLKAYLAAGGQITARLTFSPAPVAARGLQLTLVIRASL